MPAADGAPLNGDEPLTPAQRRAYFRYGRRELGEDRVDGAAVQAVARPQRDDDRSPFRVYSDSVVAATLEELAHAPAEIVDIGCGSGLYARWFQRFAAAYHGVDAAPSSEWPALIREAQSWRCRVSFHNVAAESLETLALCSDFSLSCSSLEHMADPTAAIRALAASSAPGAVGVHVVPAPWSLVLYGPHGWRRFPSARLRSLFVDAGFDVVRLYRLGGVPSLALHFFWITGLESGRALEFATGAMIPGLLAKVLARVRVKSARSAGWLRRTYSALLAAALKADPYLPWMPVGYAVVVRRRGAAA